MRIIDADKVIFNITHDFDDDGNATPSSDEELTQKCLSITDVVNWLKLAPSVDAEPIRYGKWVLKGVREPLPRDYPSYYGEDGYDEETHSIIVKHWFCSECDYDASDSFKPKDNYCPHCGAKMET